MTALEGRDDRISPRKELRNLIYLHIVVLHQAKRARSWISWVKPVWCARSYLIRKVSCSFRSRENPSRREQISVSRVIASPSCDLYPVRRISVTIFHMYCSESIGKSQFVLRTSCVFLISLVAFSVATMYHYRLLHYRKLTWDYISSLTISGAGWTTQHFRPWRSFYTIVPTKKRRQESLSDNSGE